MRQFYFLVLFSCLIGGVSLASEETEIPPVTVYGETEVETKDVTAAATIIKADDYRNRVVTIPEILSSLSGVHITRFGGVEDATSISIPGSASDEVVVLFDG